METENNKRIARNTLYMYFRMILVICVSLYTSRVILRVLGVSDYGVYNVIGGIIGMLGYINTLLSGSTSRFLTISIGEGDLIGLKRVFSLSNLLCSLSAVVFLIFGETIGLWFVNTRLNIPLDRVSAANWVYQMSLLSTVLVVIRLPYSALIIAHERMNVYAYMSIFEVIMKLLIVYALLIFNVDKLKLYGILLCVISAINLIIFATYCRHKFEETNFRFYFERHKFYEMFSYSGWNMIGAFANVLNNYGLNILLNIFFGTIVNAARGLALQINQVAIQLYGSFQTAAQPQIVKYYAQGDIPGMSRLINNTSKYTGFILLCMVIPVFFNVDGLLQLWLGQNPSYTAAFVRIILLQTLCTAMDYPIGMGIHAVGKMKLPNLTVAVINIAIFPTTYLIMRLGVSPTTGYVIYVAITPIILAMDLWILHKYTGFSISVYVRQVLFPVIKVFALGLIVAVLLNLLLPYNSQWVSLAKCFVDAIIICIIIYYCGISVNARHLLKRELAGRFFGR